MRVNHLTFRQPATSWHFANWPLALRPGLTTGLPFRGWWIEELEEASRRQARNCWTRPSTGSDRVPWRRCGPRLRPANAQGSRLL